ncbi:MAG: ImmA/IrrE family metallo-endopeptidase [Halanaerobiales bacterium]|nr:ImmA/IrrE family metallo-endopeptidase [Halanaerobiales bacterium]
MNCSNNNLSEDLINQINKEVAFINQEYSLTAPGYLKDEIFELLEKVGTLIFYPIEEENLWGIYVLNNEKHYFIINSSIELEKQVFAGAHELAHTLDIAKVKYEIVTADLMTEYVNHKEYGADIKKADLVANRFAAELLVGKKTLFEKYNELPETYNILAKVVLLSDIFLVPYKTIVKRFVETGLITDRSEINSLLEINDKQIKTVAERYECCRRNYEITEERRLGGYVNKALMLYEHELSTFEELQNRLELLQKIPEDFGVQDDSFDLYEFLRRASESSEVEDDYDEED